MMPVQTSAPAPRRVPPEGTAVPCPGDQDASCGDFATALAGFDPGGGSCLEPDAGEAPDTLDEPWGTSGPAELPADVLASPDGLRPETAAMWILPALALALNTAPAGEPAPAGHPDVAATGHTVPQTPSLGGETKMNAAAGQDPASQPVRIEGAELIGVQTWLAPAERKISPAVQQALMAPTQQDFPAGGPKSSARTDIALRGTPHKELSLPADPKLSSSPARQEQLSPDPQGQLSPVPQAQVSPLQQTQFPPAPQSLRSGPVVPDTRTGQGGPVPLDATPVATPATPPGTQILRLRLKPESLGEITVSLKLQGDSLGVTISGANARALEALRQDDHAVRRVLEQSGYDLQSVVVRIVPSADSPTGASPPGSRLHPESGAFSQTREGPSGGQGQGASPEGRNPPRQPDTSRERRHNDSKAVAQHGLVV